LNDLAGIILAGGGSRRFGADKAAALLDGRPMIAHVAERLSSQVHHVALAGARQSYGLPFKLLDDGAYANKGPLAGLASGLRWAADTGYARIVTAPCDVPKLPRNLVALLQSKDPARPVVLKTQQRLEAACAIWPVKLLPQVTQQLSAAGSNSIMAMLDAANAQVIQVSDEALDGSFANINTPEDLARL